MTDRILRLVPRAAVAAIFLLSGLSKLAAIDGTAAYVASAGLPAPHLAVWAAIVVEIGGGLVLVSGLRAAWAAWGLAAFSLTTAVVFHSPLAGEDALIHFLKNLAIAGGLAQIALDDRAPRAAPAPATA